ncbi:MAG: MFS transporter [Desulfobacterales bacterium]|jgi:OFA family oxalate/formate antiporter-like MFS transporter
MGPNPTKNIRGLILIACAVAIFWPGAFIFALPGVLRQHWQQAFGADGGQVGRTVFFILTGATCFMYLCGRWQEKYGPGRLAAVGAIICGASLLWLSRTTTMAQVNVWAFCVGASSAFIYLPGLTVVQRWYPERRGLVAGFFNMAFGMAAAVMSPVFSALLLKWGYATLTLAAGGAALTVGVAAAFLIRFPDAASRPEPGATPAGFLDDRSLKEALKSRAFWCLWLTWVFAGAAGASMLVLGTGFGLARGLSLAQAAVILTAFNLTNGCGRLISGYYSDRIGRTLTMAVSFAAAGLAYLVMPHLAAPWLWAGLAAVIGFAFGTLFAVSGPLAGDCFGMTHFGAIFGVVFTAYGFVSGPIGPWLSGHLLDISGNNYTMVFSYLGAMYLGATGLILLVRPWRECRIGNGP